MTAKEDRMNLQEPPIVRTEMLIRKPIAEVFRAFVDPTVTTRFWFTGSSGPLEAGRKIRWDWDMYGVSTQVVVRAIEPEKRILIDWDDPSTQVEWLFYPRPDGTTFVTITNSGFTGSGDEVVSQALDSTGGFSFVLAGVKALLEHGIELNLVPDHAPDKHVAG
jgi:uncharacterized protein YndB with AHSA1/START domain